MPPLEAVLDESNALLRAAGLPPCSRLEPVADGDTRNPSVMGYAADRRYAIKVSLSRPHTLALQLAERVGAACRPDLSGRMVLFLEERVEAFRRAGTGLTKADCDTRDFLVGRPARISAMLDWEQVHCGYALHQCLQAHLRLKAMGLEELFVPFCRGYEGVTGERLAQSPAVEYCFMARTLRAVGNNIPGALETVTALAEGQPLPFG